MNLRPGSRDVLPLALLVSLFLLPLASAPVFAADGDLPPSTPAELVSTYEGLADAILALKKTEANVVRSILATAFAHAQAEAGRARQAMKAGDTKAAQSALEAMAAFVGQMATEGDTSVAGVRKRLVEGGHHHHTAAEEKTTYEDGYVVVTRAAKQALLDASRAIGQISRAPSEAALDAEWRKVQTTWAGLAQK